jgi:hypothetical protein
MVKISFADAKQNPAKTASNLSEIVAGIPSKVAALQESQ